MVTETQASWSREAALHSVDGDTELLLELADIFLQGSQSLLERIEQAIDAGDSTGLYQTAHTLKGSIANFFAQDARDSAYALEMAGRAGRLEGARQVFGRLAEQLRCFEADLSDFIAAKGAE